MVGSKFLSFCSSTNFIYPLGIVTKLLDLFWEISARNLWWAIIIIIIIVIPSGTKAE